jgi:hypothetical protein
MGGSKECLNLSLIMNASVIVPICHRFLRPVGSAHWDTMHKCHSAKRYINTLLSKQLCPSVTERQCTF